MGVRVPFGERDGAVLRSRGRFAAALRLVRKNAESRAWPVGQLRPNDRGLFDALGNAMEWVEDPALRYVTGQKEDTENSKYISIDERISRLLRGGSFYDRPVLVRSALRYIFRPGNRIVTYGFRPVRTLVH